jgi:hypothetical protein
MGEVEIDIFELLKVVVKIGFLNAASEVLVVKVWFALFTITFLIVEEHVINVATFKLVRVILSAIKAGYVPFEHTIVLSNISLVEVAVSESIVIRLISCTPRVSNLIARVPETKCCHLSHPPSSISAIPEKRVTAATSL